jgi:hypothetical protein
MNAAWLPFGVLFESSLSIAGAAAGAVSIPVIIHLLNRRRFKVVTWAAMRFLLAAQKKNSRRMRIEQLLLLVVRCLIVLLIVAAMASAGDWAREHLWAKFKDYGGGGITGTARAHKIIVLDGSFSMALKSGDKARFDEARAKAAELVRKSTRGDGFSVVLMGAPPRRVVPEPSDDREKVAGIIEDTKLPHGNADLGATLKTVEDLVQGSPGKFVDKQVYFFTDLQQSTWIAKQPGAVAGTLQKIQAKARTVFVDVGVENASNVAVTGLTLGDEVATAGRETAIMATLHNYGDKTREQVSVKLFVGRARMTANEPPMELRQERESPPLRLERGQQTPVAFGYKFPAPGEYVVQVQVENDNLELDDVRSIVVTVKKDVPVLLVNGKPSGDAFDQATEWLKLALNPDDGPPGASRFLARPTVINPLKFGDETQGDLTNYDCVFVCDLPALSASEVKRLENHVRRGGGVVFCLGPQVQTGEYNRLLYKGGTGLLPAPLVGVQGKTKAFDYQLAIDADAEREPPLRAFRAATDRARLLEPRFNTFVMTGEPAAGVKPRKILGFTPVLIPGREKDPGAKQPPPGGAAVLEWNPPSPKEAGTEAPPRMRGKTVLVTTTVNSDWNRWPPSPSFPALMNELMLFASSGRLREQEHQVGDVLEVFLRTSSTGNEAKIKTPDGREEPARTVALDDASVLRWGDTGVSGVYRVTIGQDPREYFFAVNVPSGGDGTLGNESDLARTGFDEMHTTYPEWEFQVVRELGDVKLEAVTGTAESGGGAALAADIAHWLLLGLLVLVVVEVILAWQFGHYSGVAAEEGMGTVRKPTKWRWVLTFLPYVLFAFSLTAGFILVHDAITGDFLGFLPDFVRRAAETALKIPPPAPGEGSRWRLEYASYLWDTKSDPWLVGLLIGGVAVLVYLIYRREGTKPKAGMRVVMMGLRVGLVGLVLLVFLPQLKLWFERQGWPDVVIIIDDSQSMSTIDKLRDPRVKAAADKLASLGELTEANRLQLAQALVTRSDPDWLTALLTQRKVRLHVYHCSTSTLTGRIKLEPSGVADVNSVEEIGPVIEAVRKLEAKPENNASQLGAAVRQVLNDFRGSSLAAVVMLTDGVTTEGEDLVKVSKYASQMGVPLFFVGIGDDLETRDVYLHDLQVEDSVYVNDRVVFELRLTAQGYDRLTVPVTLREKGKDKELAKQMVTVEGSGKSVKVRLVYQPTEPGEHTYVIETPVQADETDKDNNRVERVVFVREAKLIKVLYVEGYRRYEFHYLKTLLERESDRLKGNKSMDLKVYLVEADPDYPAQDRSAIADFPTKAELFTYDVVILGDVDPRPDGNNKMNEHMRDLAEFVTERGGGLLMIAGERYAPRAYKDSPLRDVLPIDVTGEPQDDDKEHADGYRPDLTPVGRMHPIFRFSPDEKENDDIWDKLRELYWYADGYVPKRAAEVLAVHPKVMAKKTGMKPAEGEGAGAEKHPLVLQQFVGAGRTMFFGFNETWRWGYREDQLRFNQFWIQTVRYLARSRLGRIDLRLDRQTPYRRGEPIKVTVRFPDDAPPPPQETEVKVVVERRQPAKGADTEVRTIQLAKVERSRATYEALLTKTPEGEYKFWLSSPSAPNPKPRAEGKVLAPPGEMERLRMAASEMKRAADETHGEFYTLATADSLVKDLPVGSRVTINAPGPPWLVWNHALLFLVALLYLTTEWLMRKQQNLL